MTMPFPTTTTMATTTITTATKTMERVRRQQQKQPQPKVHRQLKKQQPQVVQQLQEPEAQTLTHHLQQPLLEQQQREQKKHRILIYQTAYNVPDGVAWTIRKLEHEILAAGHSVCILTTKSGDPANTNLVGEHPNRRVLFMDNSFRIPFTNDPNRPELTYEICGDISPYIRRQLDLFNPTIIHVVCVDVTSCYIIEYARERSIPLMGTYHANIVAMMDYYPSFQFLKYCIGPLFRNQYNFFQALYVPTPFIAKYVNESLELQNCTTVDVWGRGVDVDKFNPAHRSMTFRHKYNIADDVCVILWVGRLVPEKRPDIFAEIIRRLRKDMNPCRNSNNGSSSDSTSSNKTTPPSKIHAFVVGTGPYEKEMTDVPGITFLGWLSGQELSEAYASSDIFLFPSAIETFGNVTLEAAASGLPVVVVSGCSGHLVETSVEDDRNGYKIEEGDVESFYKATASLVQDVNLRKRFGLASRKFALKYEKSSVVRQMLTNYSKVTDEFYTLYKGTHANRDAMYKKKPGSFRAGLSPLYLPLRMLFSSGILVFGVLEFIEYCHRTFSKIRNQYQNELFDSSSATTIATSASGTSSATTVTTTTTATTTAVAITPANNDVEYIVQKDVFTAPSRQLPTLVKRYCSGIIASLISVIVLVLVYIYHTTTAAIAITFAQVVQFEGRLESRIVTACKELGRRAKNGKGENQQHQHPMIPQCFGIRAVSKKNKLS